MNSLRYELLAQLAPTKPFTFQSAIKGYIELFFQRLKEKVKFKNWQKILKLLLDIHEILPSAKGPFEPPS